MRTNRNFPPRRLDNQLTAEVEAAVADLGVVREPVPLDAAGEQVQHVAPARREELGDQLPVAAPPNRLGTEETGRRLLERGGQRALPLLRSHARRVAAERGRADAAESLLAGLAAAAASQRLGMPIGDPGCAQRLVQRVSVELRIPPRGGEAAGRDPPLPGPPPGPHPHPPL